MFIKYDLFYDSTKEFINMSDGKAKCEVGGYMEIPHF